MEFNVHHKFDLLSKAQSGRQHKFTLKEWDGDSKQSSFLCHAMYQSGEDEIRTTDGKLAKRGQVLRLQFTENGNCTPGNGLELKVDDDGWRGTDYAKLAYFLLENCRTGGTRGEPTSKEQKAAIFCQLSSLYNLMATQYGVVFLHGIRALPQDASVGQIKEALDEMITDPKLKAVSVWFQRIGEALLAGRDPDLSPPELPTLAKQENIPEWTWYHGIEVGQGAKCHHFLFYKRKDEIPHPLSYDQAHPNYAYLKVTEAAYMSGELGEKVAVFPIDPADRLHAYFDKGLPLRARLGAESLHAPLAPDVIQSVKDPVPAIKNARLINDALKKEDINHDQAVSALIMLASLYRLVATRYNNGFGYHPNGQQLAPHFYDDPKEDTDAFEAKAHAFRHGYRKEDLTDTFIVDKQMYTRPVTVRDRASLAEYIRDSNFSREADNALTIAAHAMKGQDMGYAKQGEALPIWVLGEKIGNEGRIAYPQL